MTLQLYEFFNEGDSLQQGDILEPTPLLKKVFGEVHPHFCDDKYLGFIVLTQSCDLVREDNRCPVRYINVGVIRSLSSVLPMLLNSISGGLGNNVYQERVKAKAVELLTRIINQNEQKAGLFYLYPNGETGIGEDAVAFLRISVALRVDHYDLMVKARRGRLKSEFANKLGWLLGNLYARVGTPDWPKTKIEEMTQQLLEAGPEEGYLWLEEKAYKALEKSNCVINNLSHEEIRTIAEKHIVKYKDIAINQTIKIIIQEIPDIKEDQIMQLKKQLQHDATLATTFKK